MTDNAMHELGNIADREQEEEQEFDEQLKKDHDVDAASDAPQFCPDGLYGQDTWVCKKLRSTCLARGIKENCTLKQEVKVENKELVPQAIVAPAVSAQEAKASWDKYQELKKAIIEPSDVQQIQNKQFLKKSYWRKVKTFFNLSVEIVTERYEEREYGDFAYHFTCKAIAPNGCHTVGTGSCTAYEKAKWDNLSECWSVYNKYSKASEQATPNSVHNVRSMAETRAFNRAVSNLVGGGEVSADEIVDTEHSNGNGHAAPAKPVSSSKPSGSTAKASAAQVRLINVKSQQKGISEAALKAYLSLQLNVESRNDIPKDKVNDVLKWIEDCKEASE